MNINFDANPIDNEANQFPLDYFLQFEWPEHIETALRRLLWISLVELAEGECTGGDHSSYIKWLVATHPDTPPAVLEYLAMSDESPKLLVRVAENPQTSGTTLTRLAAHENNEVRVAVADNRNTPPQVINELIKDADLDVRYSLAENANLDLAVLQELAKDENGYVAARAKRTLVRANPGCVRKLNTEFRSQDQQKRKLG
jgi:hypothetical protein